MLSPTATHRDFLLHGLGNLLIGGVHIHMPDLFFDYTLAGLILVRDNTPASPFILRYHVAFVNFVFLLRRDGTGTRPSDGYALIVFSQFLCCSMKLCAFVSALIPRLFCRTVCNFSIYNRLWAQHANHCARAADLGELLTLDLSRDCRTWKVRIPNNILDISRRCSPQKAAWLCSAKCKAPAVLGEH